MKAITCGNGDKTFAASAIDSTAIGEIKSHLEVELASHAALMFQWNVRTRRTRKVKSWLAVRSLADVGLQRRAVVHYWTTWEWVVASLFGMMSRNLIPCFHPERNYTTTSTYQKGWTKSTSRADQSSVLRGPLSSLCLNISKLWVNQYSVATQTTLSKSFWTNCFPKTAYQYSLFTLSK